jgi:hypothetical protein
VESLPTVRDRRSLAAFAVSQGDDGGGEHCSCEAGEKSRGDGGEPARGWVLGRAHHYRSVDRKVSVRVECGGYVGNGQRELPHAGRGPVNRLTL